MIALFGNIKKEITLLLRDKAGLIFLFVMPIVLVLLMTLLQDKTTKKLHVEQMDIAVVNLDQSIVGNALVEGLQQMSIFRVHQVVKGDTLSKKTAQEMVMNGEFQMGIIIPKFASRNMKRVVSNELRKQMPSVGAQVIDDSLLKVVQLELFFDPIIKATLRQAMAGAINQLLSAVQTQIVFKSYTSALEQITGKQNTGDYPAGKFSIVQVGLSESNDKMPNSTQHNVPAWTVFAIFFMVIPLASQIINEREGGSLQRLKMSPTSLVIPFIVRIGIYSIIAVIQAVVLFFIGYFLLPLLGMEAYDIHEKYFSFIIFTLIIGLAASSYAMAVGSVAKTHHQASIFGSISVVLLAAIGGIWVPMYMMPEALLKLSAFSPLNWALSGYYDIILKGYDFWNLEGYVMKLIFFTAINFGIAFIFENRKNK